MLVYLLLISFVLLALVLNRHPLEEERQEDIAEVEEALLALDFHVIECVHTHIRSLVRLFQFETDLRIQCQLRSCSFSHTHMPTHTATHFQDNLHDCYLPR